MKKLVNLLIMAFWSVTIAWAALEEKDFTISGEIAGMEDGATVTLAVVGTLDIPHGWVSSRLEGGKFELKASAAVLVIVPCC